MLYHSEFIHKEHFVSKTDNYSRSWPAVELRSKLLMHGTWPQAVPNSLCICVFHCCPMKHNRAVHSWAWTKLRETIALCSPRSPTPMPVSFKKNYLVYEHNLHQKHIFYGHEVGHQLYSKKGDGVTWWHREGDFSSRYHWNEKCEWLSAAKRKHACKHIAASSNRHFAKFCVATMHHVGRTGWSSPASPARGMVAETPPVLSPIHTYIWCTCWNSLLPLPHGVWFLILLHFLTPICPYVVLSGTDARMHTFPTLLRAINVVAFKMQKNRNRCLRDATWWGTEREESKEQDGKAS